MISRVLFVFTCLFYQMTSAQSPARAQDFFPHDWTNIKEEFLTPQNGMWITPFQFFGDNPVRVDDNATVYFGKPKQLWSNGKNQNSVGVNFISCFGFGLTNPGKFKVSIDRKGPNDEKVIQITGVTLSGMPAGTTLDFQVVASTQVAKSIDYEIRFNWRLNKPDDLPKGSFNEVTEQAKSFLWNLNKEYVLQDFSEILPLIGDRSDQAVLADSKAYVFNDNGQPLDNIRDQYFPGIFAIPGRGENSDWGVVDETKNKVFKITPDQNSIGENGKLHNGIGMAFSTSDEFPLWIWEPRIKLPNFEQIGGYAVKYRQEKQADCWRVWMFNDQGNYAHHLGIPCLEDVKFKHEKSSDPDYKWIHVPIGTIGDRINDFNEENPIGYPDPVTNIVRFVKFMGSVDDRPCSNPTGCKGSSIDMVGPVYIDSVVALRMQPKSYTIVQRSPNTQIKIQLILDGSIDPNASIAVTATAQMIGSAKKYTSESSNGVITFNVPSANYAITFESSYFNCSPSNVTWKPGDGVLYAYLSKAQAAWQKDIKNQTLNEGDVRRILLTDWIYGENFVHPAIEVEELTHSGLPWKFDPVTRILELGNPNSDATGTTRLRLRASVVGLMPEYREITFNVLPVNDPPSILASRFSASAGTPLVVQLDDLLSGKPRWVQDPDDDVTNLEWTAEWSGDVPNGALLSIQNRTLRVVPPVGTSGDLFVNLSVQDPSGAKTSRSITVSVVPPVWEISGLIGRQLETGTLEWTFSSRFTKEAVALQKEQIELVVSSGQVSFPADLEVLQQPTLLNGLWSEGRYRLTVSPLSTGGGKSIADWIADGTKAEFSLPLTAYGRNVSFRSTISPVDFKGSFATLVSEPVYSPTDLSRRHPSLRVRWEWKGDEPHSVVLSVLETSSNRLQTFKVDKGANEYLIPNLTDGEQYAVGLQGRDEKNNLCGGNSLISLPWGTYPYTLNLNDHQLSQVSGNIRLMSSRTGSLQRIPLSQGKGGIHPLPELTPGKWFIEIEDPRWVGFGISKEIIVDRAAGVANWNLIPANFLMSGKSLIEQRLDQDGLSLFVPTRGNLLEGERPSKISLIFQNDVGTEATFDIPVRADQVSLNGSDWNVQWLRKDLPKDLIKDPIWGSAAVWLDRIVVGTILSNNPNSLFRSEMVKAIDVKGHQRLISFIAPVFDKLGATNGSILNRTVFSDGKAVWQGALVPIHGARWESELCRYNTDATLDCSKLDAFPLIERQAFKTDLAAAYSVGTLPSFIADPNNKGVVFTPANVEAAAAQWSVWSAKSGEYYLRADLASQSFINSISYSLDSGKSWKASFFSNSGWKELGVVNLRSGWNSIAIRLPKNIKLRALQTTLSNSEFPKTSSLDLASSPQLWNLKTDLIKDRNYRERISIRDAYGNFEVHEDYFDARPQGLFADMVLIQKAGELVELRTASTEFDPNIGGLHLLIDNQIVEFTSIERQGSGMVLSFPLDALPASIRSASLDRPDQLNWTLVNTQSFTTTTLKRSCVFMGFGCISTPVVNTHTSNTPIALRWTGHDAWKSPFDSRKLPNPDVVVSHIGTDSLAFRVTGYESSPTRRSISGTLTATWSPGSQCLSASVDSIPVRHVFDYSQTLGALWSPRLHNTAYGVAGDPVSLASQPSSQSANFAKTRPQWADFGNGGGFYPEQAVEILGETPATVSFLIRNSQNTNLNARLAILPGVGNGEQRQGFLYRVVPDALNPDRAWKMGRGFRNQDQTTWMWATSSDPVFVLQPGLNRLEIRIADAGASWEGFALVPCDLQGVATLPTIIATELPTEGQSGVRELTFGAGSLSPATNHSFEFQFHDRFGNTSEISTISLSTATPNSAIPRVATTLVGWDATSGWITGSTAQVLFKPATLTSTSLTLKARLLIRRGSDRRLEPGLAREIFVIPTQDDETWSASLDLNGYALTEAEYAQGDRVVVEAWFDDGESAGPHSVVEFGVRNQDQTISIGGLLPTKIGSLTFTPRRAWLSTDGRNYADLVLSKLELFEGDTSRYQLLLRGATIERNGTQLLSVSGGMATVEHCGRMNSQSAWVCSPTDRLPFSIGRWPGWIDAQSSRIVGKGNQTQLQVGSLEITDDAQRPVRNSNSVAWGDEGFLYPLELSRDRFWIRNVLAAGEEEAFGLEACRTTATRTAIGALQLTMRGCSEATGPFLTFPLHLKSDGVWSLIGAGFDSIPSAYTVTWRGTSVHNTNWTSGLPSNIGLIELPANDVSIKKSSIKEATGASLWGYTFKSYDFGRQGIKNLVMDLHLPDGNATPYQNGVPQVVKSFTGGKVIVSTDIMNGQPVLDGEFVSADPTKLNIGSTLTLEGVDRWAFTQQAGIGWILKPTGSLRLKGPQTDGWRVENIDGQTAGMADKDAFYYPLSKLVLGPDLFLEIDGTHKVEFSTSFNNLGLWNSKGAVLTTQITPVPGGSSLELSLEQSSLTLGNFFTNTGTNTGIPVTPTDLDVRLDGEFRLADIEAYGTTPDGSEVRVAGSPYALLVPSGRYQVLANRGQILVRLSRPQGYLDIPFAPSGANRYLPTFPKRKPPSTNPTPQVFPRARTPVVNPFEPLSNLPKRVMKGPNQLVDLGNLNQRERMMDARSNPTLAVASPARLLPRWSDQISTTNRPLTRRAASSWMVTSPWNCLPPPNNAAHALPSARPDKNWNSPKTPKLMRSK